MSENFENSSLCINKLIPIFSIILENFSINNYDILHLIFQDSIPEYIQLVENMSQTNQSDIVLSYGNNNYVLKIFLEHYLVKEYKGNYIILNFDGYIHTTEDYVLKAICQRLNIEFEKAGFENYQKEIENYFNNFIDDTLVVIFYENIEYLIKKKKQILLYTLLDIINSSKNLLFVGFTSNYNLTDLMEKRIRSRFSQKTICPNIKKFDNIMLVIEQLFTNFPFQFSNNILNNSFFPIIKEFHDILIQTELFIPLIYKYFSLGNGIVEILLKIKYIITMIDMSFNDYMLKKEKGDEILRSELVEILNNVLKEIEINEEKGSYYSLLKQFPKLHIIFLIALCHCTSDYKENITIGMIYHKYYSLMKRSNSKKSKLDLVLAKKYLEELANSNLISIKKDDKYGNVYQLKLPISETIKLILHLKKENKIDYLIEQFCNNII